ncbi:TPA: malonyl-[acyl-carrier protein] O-methyltransferase BioC [bacterium]|nr:malonyl-[acyl-carrier protein] O-methyltransferase BioC [bacterium]
MEMDQSTKERIKRSFSRAAPFYDEYASIQIEAASRLIEGIKTKRFSSILEIGCGTGTYTLMLKSYFPQAEITAVDFAPGMLGVASKKLNSQGVRFLLADGEEELSFGRDGFDLITSNATFQWFNDLERAIKGYRNLLKEEGMLYFSLFGPETFCELKETLNQFLPLFLPTSHFLNKDRVEWVLSPFRKMKIEEVTFTQRYPNLKELLKTIRHTSSNGLFERKGLFFTPTKIKRLEDLYLERFGTIQATYQLFFCQGEV